MRNTPAQAGFYMPAEWEKHEGTWLQWPNDDTHPGSQVRLEHIWLLMTETLHQHEVVHIVVPDERRQEHVYQQVVYYGFDQSNIDIRVLPTNDVWVREIWIPELTHPRPPRAGKPLGDVRKRARAKLDRVLAEHEPEPLEEAAQAELRVILDAAGQELGNAVHAQAPVERRSEIWHPQ